MRQASANQTNTLFFAATVRYVAKMANDTIISLTSFHAKFERVGYLGC